MEALIASSVSSARCCSAVIVVGWIGGALLGRVVGFVAGGGGRTTRGCSKASGNTGCVGATGLGCVVMLKIVGLGCVTGGGLAGDVAVTIGAAGRLVGP